MKKEPIIHLQTHRAGMYSGTACGHFVLTTSTAAIPLEVTCKACLRSVPRTKDMCNDCEDNFYNGNNPMSIKECWNFKTAHVVRRKKVGINDVPPWKHTPIAVLSCYRQSGFVMTDPDKEY